MIREITSRCSSFVRGFASGSKKKQGEKTHYEDKISHIIVEGCVQSFGGLDIVYLDKAITAYGIATAKEINDYAMEKLWTRNQKTTCK